MSNDSAPIVVAPLLYGLIVSCPLFGTSAAQACYYYLNYPSDSFRFKIFIAILMVLEFVHTILIAYASNVWYLRDHLVFVLPNALLASGYIAYVVISLVQSAYAWRVYQISDGNKWLVSILIFTSFAQLVAGCGMNTNLALNEGILSIHHEASEIFGGLQLASSLVCDFLITSSLVYYLRINRGVFRETQNLVDRLIIYSINIGLVTSVISLVALATWFAMPDNFIFTTFHILIGKVYVNSWLVTLNSRAAMGRSTRGGGYEVAGRSSDSTADTTRASDVLRLSTFKASDSQEL